jgi:hypothetical protein
MNTELRWIAGQSASCLHATEALRRGRPLIDARMAASVTAPARELLRQVEACGLPEEKFFYHLVPLSAGIESNRELAQTALRKTIGSGPRAESMIGSLAGWIGDVEVAVRRDLPGMVDELLDMVRPLESHWSKLGPAILDRVGQLTDERLIVPRADVIVVYPATGGGWQAHLDYNSVRVEPVGTDSVDRLPHILRLVWLLAQLNVDLPIFSERIPAGHRPAIAALAMLPVVLAAASGLELATCDLATIRLALQEWQIEVDSKDDTAETVFDWWETYQASKPPTTVALAALHQMTYDFEPTTYAL